MLRITDKEFNEIRSIMYKRTGVFLRPTKKPLTISRLKKRLEELNLKDFTSYIALLKTPGSSELEIFVNAITTNETFFFRHAVQFNFLSEVLFPDLVKKKFGQSHPGIRMWSAACSTGEEPYSMAIAGMEFFKKHPGGRFKIYASDINSSVIAIAKEARYPERSLREVPKSLREKYFKPVINKKAGGQLEFHLNTEVKSNVEFVRHNLLEPFPYTDFDIIFMRNVMIYFDKETKQRVINALKKNLFCGGHLLISLSESLTEINTDLKIIRHGVYQKT